MNNLFNGIAALLLFMLLIGCSKEEKQTKTTEPVAFKTQLDAAKQVGNVLQDAADQQQHSISEQSQ